MENKIIGAIAVLALLVGGYASLKPSVQRVVQEFGSAGQTQTSRAYFMDQVVIGGNDFATSSRGSVTYTAASFGNARVIEHNAEAATTATLPTAAALNAVGFLPNKGDTTTIFIHASTTAITLAGNTGFNLYTASSTKAVAAGAIGELRVVRLGATEGSGLWGILSAD